MITRFEGCAITYGPPGGPAWVGRARVVLVDDGRYIDDGVLVLRWPSIECCRRAYIEPPDGEPWARSVGRRDWTVEVVSNNRVVARMQAPLVEVRAAERLDGGPVTVQSMRWVGDELGEVS